MRVHVAPCFGEGADPESLDREAFKFQHKLLDHLALRLKVLARVLAGLPKEKVMYSKRLLQNGDDFEATFSKKPSAQSIGETIENIQASVAHIMVNSHESEASFAPLRKQLIADVEALMKERGAVGSVAIDPKPSLFIASVNSVTPFHIDRHFTILMQCRGRKQVCIFPQWDERAAGPQDREAYRAYESTRLPRSVMARRHVRNGNEDVSTSMSIIFNTPQGRPWRGAINFNYRFRRVLSRIGMSPAPVGAIPWRDGSKARKWPATRGVTNALRAGGD